MQVRQVLEGPFAKKGRSVVLPAGVVRTASSYSVSRTHGTLSFMYLVDSYARKWGTTCHGTELHVTWYLLREFWCSRPSPLLLTLRTTLLRGTIVNRTKY